MTPPAPKPTLKKISPKHSPTRGPSQKKPLSARIEPAAIKDSLHPRNRHRGRYDFPALVESLPALAPFVRPNAYGDVSIDFADPLAVKVLNQAILKQFYGVDQWDVPPGYLCPPIPGRADYLHQLADLLAESNGGVVPRGEEVNLIDLGVGANCVYPIIGQAEYGWHFLGTDIDRTALESAAAIAEANPALDEALELRQQSTASQILRGVLQPGEVFDATICNPPFHSSLAEAKEGTHRKWKNLGQMQSDAAAPKLNFGGQGNELWCEGGEITFVRRLIRESVQLANGCLWFTTLVSKESNLPLVLAALKQARVPEQRVIEMAQGQKRSRVVAWSFLDAAAREAWARQRWGCAD